MAAAMREATAADYPAIAALYHESDAFHAAGAPDIFRLPPAPLLNSETFAGWLADPQQALLVAEVAGRVVGLAHVSIRDASPSPASVPARVAYLHELVVQPGQRGAGVGALLMQEVERWSRDQGATVVELNVWDFPGSAVSFYERLGYATRARRMRKRLSPL
jgi:diamine N-acetyltransferase